MAGVDVGGKILGGLRFGFGKIAGARHTVHEVVGGVEGGQFCEGVCLQEVAFVDSDATAPGPALGFGSVSNQDVNVMARFDKPRCEPAAHVSRRAGYQNAHIVSWGLRGFRRAW